MRYATPFFAWLLLAAAFAHAEASAAGNAAGNSSIALAAAARQRHSVSGARRSGGGGFDVNPSIAYGKLAGDKDFPWIALLLGKRDAPWGCAGSLIRPQVVVTAAHCLYDDMGKPITPLAVKVGLLNKLWDAPRQYEYRKIKNVVRNPRYNSMNMKWDIGLLILEKPVKTKPVALAPPNFYIRSGLPLITAGWGADEHNRMQDRLKYVTVPYVPFAKCDDMMQQFGMGQVPETHLCAGMSKTKSDSCRGDSGGPLLWRKKGYDDVLIGIVSYGPSNLCGTSQNLGAYTSLREPAMIDWLKARFLQHRV